ncbi:MEDS domain-containing protein [Actinoplanes sp. GCM10030250]|uniref:MEDS domain-containing protein n=1 Tax=Actinoplanes sp. GCM10030250 TaxID=3273376 RepID=UPI003607CB57
MALDRLRPGDHVCVVVNDEPLRTRSVAAYVRAGLRDQHRVIYHGRGAELLEAELVAQGVDVAAASRRDQLRIAGPGPSCLRGDGFDPEVALCSWRAEADRARAAGHRGLRSIGDMFWTDRLPWYEAQVNRLFAEGFAMGVCLYDPSLFTPGQLRQVSRSHPATFSAETAPRTVPLLRAVRTTEPAGIRLEGEADLSNRDALEAVMEHLIADTAVLTVDVSRLRFADGAAVSVLMRVPSDGKHRLRLVGCSPALRRLFELQGAGPAVEYA